MDRGKRLVRTVISMQRNTRGHELVNSPDTFSINERKSPSYFSTTP